MANVKKTVKFLNTDDFITILAEKKGYAKIDVKNILDGMREVLEECVVNDVDVDLRGILHLTVKKIEYSKPPGLIKNETGQNYSRIMKRIKYRVPLNFKNLLKIEDDKKIKENGGIK